MVSDESVVTFHHVYKDALPPLRADKAALGTMPAGAFQYCEAMRVASSFGWYIFPAEDIQLIWDGVDVFHAVDGEWVRLSSVTLGDEFLAYWDAHAPEDLKGRSPPFLSSLFVPGLVQIWSGLFVSTADQWSVHIGPLANMPQSRSFSCFEGIVETDSFKPCPLFINIRLQVTDKEILIPKTMPLFQLKPLRRESYSEKSFLSRSFQGLEKREGGMGGMSDDDWSGYRKTVRPAGSANADRTIGTYGADVRRRRKSENQE